MFLGFIDEGNIFVEMASALHISYSTAKRLYKRYIAINFSILSTFKPSSEKKSSKKTYFAFEKNMLNSEISADHSVNPKELCENLRVDEGKIAHSLST